MDALNVPRPPVGTWSVRVERNRLTFAAAHMATFAGGCEPLHGHNYALALRVEGPLTEDAWVIDFGLLKRLGRELCDELDHKVLVQLSGALRVTRRAASYHLGFGDREYSLPASDVFELPCDNSTAERIAEYLWARLRARLAEAPGVSHLALLAVEVEESPGQSATYTATL